MQPPPLGREVLIEQKIRREMRAAEKDAPPTVDKCALPPSLSLRTQ
jgi:hypothetical protein